MDHIVVLSILYKMQCYYVYVKCSNCLDEQVTKFLQSMVKTLTDFENGHEIITHLYMHISIFRLCLFVLACISTNLRTAQVFQPCVS